MPFRRRRRFRHRNRKIARPTRGAKIDRKFFNVERKIKKLQNNIDLKWQDTNIVSTVFPHVTPSSMMLNNIPQGVGATDRIGSQALMTSINMKFILQSNSSNTSTQQVRMLLVLDKQYNGTDPLLNQVLDITEMGTDIEYLFAPYNMHYAGRFRTLWDKVYTLVPHMGIISSTPDADPAITTVTTMLAPKIFIKKKKKMNIQVIFESDSIRRNPVYLFLYTTAMSNTPILNGYIRVFFKDA